MTQELSFIAWAFSEWYRTFSNLSVSKKTEAKKVHFRRRAHIPNIVPKPCPFFSSGRDLGATLLVISRKHHADDLRHGLEHDGWIIIVLFNFPVLCCVAFGPFFRYSVVFFSVVNKLCGDTSYEGISWKKMYRGK